MKPFISIIVAFWGSFSPAHGGVFHRVKSPSQSDETCKMQVETQEIWGKASRNILQSDFPKVKAYRGPLPKGEKGIEFVTDIPTDRGNPPHLATWSAARDDVWEEDGFAKIPVAITKNTQCPD